MGIDGLFAFDHLWPPGRPGVQCLPQFPLLGAVAAVTADITLGTLIARVDSRPIDHLVTDLLRLREVAGDRVIAGLGNGDRLTAEEDEYRGIKRLPYERRLELVEETATRLKAEEFPVWLAGSTDQMRDVAKRVSASIVMWEPKVGTERPEGYAWAGVLSGNAFDIRNRLAVDARDAAWAVCGYRGGVEVERGLPVLSETKALIDQVRE